jgi:penicillin-binding protein 1A
MSSRVQALRVVLRKLGRGLASMVMVLFTPIVCVAVVLATLIFMPLPATLPQPRAGVESSVSHVLDADGNEIGIYKQFDTNIPVNQADIPQVLKDAVVSAEDKHFYDHGGVDVAATVRALIDDLQSGEVVQGGSTITQQYVKNAFTNGDRTVARKVYEAILASQLDRQVDKDTILYRYLSAIYFGSGSYGVGAAAQTYFRKPVSQLNLSEAALLAGVIPSPSKYSPLVDPLLAEQRRRLVLDLMLQQGRITQAAHDLTSLVPVWLSDNGPPPGPATIVYPPEQQQSTQPWFTDYVHSWLETHLPGCQLHACPLLDKGGLRIVTTLDPRLQQAAQDEVAATMGRNDLELEMSLVSVEPPTGFVKAMVGGRDWAFSQVNTGLAPRQPGSSFKPFVLAAAFEQGIQPSKVYSGAPLRLPDGTTIRNYGGEQFGRLELRQATWHSVNGVFARLILDAGVDKTMAMAQRLGADMPAYSPSVYGASVALGVIDVSPLQMASAYGVFADHGKKAPPTPVLQVFDRDGKLILDNTHAADQAQQVVSDVVADNVTDVLRGVLVSGTAAGKGLGPQPAAGKTGTAEDAANAWFVGYTPTLSTAVWMGHMHCGAGPQCGMHNVNGVREVTGGTIPASTWQNYMKRALDGVPVTDFNQPAPIEPPTPAPELDARKGFDPGNRRYPAAVPREGPYVNDIQAPSASAPTTTTTTTAPPPTTTTVPPPPPAPPPTARAN